MNQKYAHLFSWLHIIINAYVYGIFYSRILIQAGYPAYRPFIGNSVMGKDTTTVHTEPICNHIESHRYRSNMRKWKLTILLSISLLLYRVFHNVTLVEQLFLDGNELAKFPSTTFLPLQVVLKGRVHKKAEVRTILCAYSLRMCPNLHYGQWESHIIKR